MNNKATKRIERRALVTGGAHGIGWAICQLLAKRGYAIALADLDAETAQKRVSSLGNGHVAMPVDLTDRETAAALPERAATALGGLDVVINNAGITDTSGRSIVDLPASDFDQLVALNLVATEVICGAAGDLLGSGGNIVNIASGAAYKPLALRGPYSATKAAVVELTYKLAQQYAPRGICVSAIAPGYTRTPLVENLHRAGQVDLDEVAKNHPLGRMAVPEDIASVAAFAASEQGRVLAGQTLLVDGGGSIGPSPDVEGPQLGLALDGHIAIIGATGNSVSNFSKFDFQTSDKNELKKVSALSAVIDIQLLSCDLCAEKALNLIRNTAIACAALSNRACDFALLYVMPEGDSAESSAAAAASAMLARTLAVEWGPSNMRVNAVRWCGKSQQDLWGLCRFLVGQDASFITGQVIRAGDRS